MSFWRGGAVHDVAAHREVEGALARGVLERPTACQECGQTPPPRTDGASQVEAHHDDYNEPLVVRWLCKRCHYAWHRAHKAVPRRVERREVDDFADLFAPPLMPEEDPVDFGEDS